MYTMYTTQKLISFAYYKEMHASVDHYIFYIFFSDTRRRSILYIVYLYFILYYNI